VTRMVRIATKFMPVNLTHLEYDANAAVCLRARDVFVGEVTRYPSPVTWFTSWTVKKNTPFWSRNGQVLDALSTTYVEPLIKPVKFSSVGCAAVAILNEIPGAREKRGAKTAKSRQKPPKTAMKPNGDKSLAGNSDPMAGRARFRVTIREPRRDAEFLPTLERHFFSGHLWSSLVTSGHLWTSSWSGGIPLNPVHPRLNSPRDYLVTFRPLLLEFRFGSPLCYLPSAIPGARPKSAKKSAKSCQKVPKSAKPPPANPPSPGWAVPDNPHATL
jgi:hypothetical protein